MKESWGLYAGGQRGKTAFATEAQPPASEPKSGLGTLEQFLDYELRSATRYRRFTTLVLISRSAEAWDPRALIGEIMRSSDEFFYLEGGGAAILMGETDGIGALAAVGRYRLACREEKDIRFSLTTYPSDVRSVAEMLVIGQRRLQKAKGRSEPGCVVSND